jgi:hypothetical protein
MPEELGNLTYYSPSAAAPPADYVSQNRYWDLQLFMSRLLVAVNYSPSAGAPPTVCGSEDRYWDLQLLMSRLLVVAKYSPSADAPRRPTPSMP